ncbi:MAG: AmmeMemoRadiSam system radical SAM enzyme [Tepidanaerobacter acetatoxydans]|uniref:AmmeMemoRadiSam system radical SAM enzyme n=1 Tax=Tepidanaerobacter acetatoxydans TaxID=499229 RepID=UPI0026F1623F|nr:AmmeMemoRadiSam system radical SAM enzyme [Tepidanaerobacter acetatoxydans]NLU10188.1 AmmeMemoRadiSam system radical SAM enzyme [Tepidanaerobacter acetatoxydans]
MKEAMYYKKNNDGTIECGLCPHHCRISQGRSGICRVRKNIDGKLYSMNYGRVSSLAMDPIEKKPLYHFYPGSMIFSVGGAGCNFRCKFCQNWQIAQLTDIPTSKVSAEELINAAKQRQDNIGIAYTYNEPTIWYEFVLECAKLAKREGLKNVLITNGFIEKEPLQEILPFIDAMNIDVKAFHEDFYKDMVSGQLLPVKETVEEAQRKCHVEITTLIIPGINDSMEEIKALAQWLSSLRKDIPLHLTRYFPNYRLDILPTPVEKIKMARDTAMKYLDYVYTGNMIDEIGGNTYCPSCGELIIERAGYRVQVKTEDNKCPKCGTPILLIKDSEK